MISNAKRNWKTTLLGVLSLAFLGLNIAKDPSVLYDPQGQASITASVAAGVGLILAKDGDQTGVAAK